MSSSIEIEILELEHEWRTHPRWARAARPYRAADVLRLRGSVRVEHAAARRGAERLWDALHSGRPVRALGVLTGDQATQAARAGADAIYVPGWPISAGLRPAASVPSVVRRVRACLERADEIHRTLGRDGIDWDPPIVADAGAGCGGDPDALAPARRTIDAGAACVQIDDRLDPADERGRPARTLLAPVEEAVRRLVAARFAADVAGARTIVLVRTHARGDEAVARAIAYAPYADVLRLEAPGSGLEEARRFARAVHARLPGKLLACEGSPSPRRRERLDAASVARLERDLASVGYRLVLVTRAGLHALEVASAEPALPSPARPWPRLVAG
jgi:isocitrate lyase